MLIEKNKLAKNLFEILLKISELDSVCRLQRSTSGSEVFNPCVQKWDSKRNFL